MTTYPTTIPGSPNIALWADPETIEPDAVTQLTNTAALPWTHRVAVMPDVHLGKGATIGSVIAMRGAVAPSAVGVDIGCGMSAVYTGLSAADLPDDLRAVRDGIEQAVPVGFKAHDHAAPVTNLAAAVWREGVMGKFGALRAPALGDLEGRALAQCGTLGGGNHFIELCLDSADGVWVMLHSGSRGIGKQIADRHINTAKGLEHNAALPDRDLAVFLAGTPEMYAYLHDLSWAQDYAALNRAVMLHLVSGVIARMFPTAKFANSISCHHNYVAFEKHDGLDLIVTRKGAIRAEKGDKGLIPGSMGTGSYIVKGLGNDAGLRSASHGAGRRMSRSKARKTFTAADLAAQTAGVECRKDDAIVDEIPAAYKPIEDVIDAQTSGPSPLVEVVDRLRTILCVKG